MGWGVAVECVWWEGGFGEQTLIGSFQQFCPGGELFDYIVAREKLKVRALVDTSTLVAELPVESVASCSKYSQNIPLPL